MSSASQRARGEHHVRLGQGGLRRGVIVWDEQPDAERLEDAALDVVGPAHRADGLGDDDEWSVRDVHATLLRAVGSDRECRRLSTIYDGSAGRTSITRCAMATAPSEPMAAGSEAPRADAATSGWHAGRGAAAGHGGGGRGRPRLVDPDGDRHELPSRRRRARRRQGGVSALLLDERPAAGDVPEPCPVRARGHRLRGRVVPRPRRRRQHHLWRLGIDPDGRQVGPRPRPPAPSGDRPAAHGRRRSPRTRHSPRPRTTSGSSRPGSRSAPTTRSTSTPIARRSTTTRSCWSRPPRA